MREKKDGRKDEEKEGGGRRRSYAQTHTYAYSIHT